MLGGCMNEGWTDRQMGRMTGEWREEDLVPKSVQ